MRDLGLPQEGASGTILINRHFPPYYLCESQAFLPTQQPKSSVHSLQDETQHCFKASTNRDLVLFVCLHIAGEIQIALCRPSKPLNNSLLIPLEIRQLKESFNVVKTNEDSESP